MIYITFMIVPRGKNADLINQRPGKSRFAMKDRILRRYANKKE